MLNRPVREGDVILDFAKIKGDLTRLMHQDRHPEARFTTMIDFYALPAAFPGWEEARSKNSPVDRVRVLEESLQSQFGDNRFHPYIQLHEFESLLYCDLSELQCRLNNSEHGIAALQHEVRNLAPEDINEGAHTAPSKRIINHLPVYERSKIRVGAPAAAAIGLLALRDKCPHFHDWLSHLERLA